MVRTRITKTIERSDENQLTIIMFRNENGQLHKDYGPAAIIIYDNGDRAYRYLINGEHQRNELNRPSRRRAHERAQAQQLPDNPRRLVSVHPEHILRVNNGIVLRWLSPRINLPRYIKKFIFAGNYTFKYGTLQIYIDVDLLELHDGLNNDRRIYGYYKHGPIGKITSDRLTLLAPEEVESKLRQPPGDMRITEVPITYFDLEL